uniref:helix-turn-helix domain-containing protein n=1 Tax=Nakamurella multipartita TaxID=53461 RepID=UPI003898FECA
MSRRRGPLIERERIAGLKRAGVGVREMARRLGRDASTVPGSCVAIRAIHDPGTSSFGPCPGASSTSAHQPDGP